MNNTAVTRHRSGYVTLIGRPNVGKSTLLNALLGEKVAIVTPKPQTTRNKIVGIKNLPDAQVIFIDTPGIHSPKHRLGTMMLGMAVDALEGVDIVILMVEPSKSFSDTKLVSDILSKTALPVFLVINKIDTVKKSQILPVIDHFRGIYPFREIIPVSALKHEGTDDLLTTICSHLPEGPKYYPEDIVTDQMERFMVSEIVREKIMYSTKEEIPHSIAVQVIDWKEREDGSIFISCNIYVERDSQKAIIIGKKGEMLKTIGSSARPEIERLLHAKTYIELWVKVKKHWRNDEQILKDLGYR